MEILELLKKRKHHVGEIMKKLDKEQSLVSHHLKSLRECGLIESQVEGKKRIYKIKGEELPEFLKNIEKLSKKLCQE